MLPPKRKEKCEGAHLSAFPLFRVASFAYDKAAARSGRGPGIEGEVGPLSEIPAGETPRFDPIRFALERPLATARELAVGFDQLIDSIGDLTGATVARVITPAMSALTISWQASTIPSDDWLDGVEEQLRAFAACSGLRVYFRRH